MVKIALGIEYEGSDYFGWQRQQSVVSIQGEVEKALSRIANEPIEVFCAGRTDAGVHATGQVIHFETNAVRDLSAWTLGMNTLLPFNIAVIWAKEVDDSFHARFSATARRYRYIIHNSPLRSGLLNRGLTHFHFPLDEALMHQAGQALLGENDFSSFRSAQCQSNSPNRNVHHLNVYRQDHYVIIDIQANAFLHHMVRNIAGSLCEVGVGNQPVTWLAELLAKKDRTQAAATAKPNGLYLMNVIYPDEYAIPQQESGPLFLR